MATQLGIYNEALRLLGERRLSDVSENREPARVLNDVWNDGLVDACLEQGMWNFATRAIRITYSTLVTPTFGFRRAFDKPTDFIRTAGISADENFNTPLLRYFEEVGFWFADNDTLYIRYVSNHTDYGLNLTDWPQSFSKFVAAFLAAEACVTLTQDEAKQARVLKTMLFRRSEARSRDAMADPTAFPPQGSWTSARVRGSGGDRGNRGSLIG